MVSVDTTPLRWRPGWFQAALGLWAALTRYAQADVIVWESHVENGDYTIASGNTLLLNGSNHVAGQLIVSAGAILTIDASHDMFLSVANIDISGSFLIGSEDAPYANKAMIELNCGSSFPPSDERRKGVVVRANGTLAVFGTKGAGPTWAKLRDTALAQSTCLPFDAPDSWQVGDDIVIPSTDYDPYQAEERTIVAKQADCVEVDRPLEFMHYGHVTEGVDERAEIGLLSRNIVFRGCQEVGDMVHVGGHLMVMEGFGRAQVQGVELQNFGQGDKIGRYAMHFHLCAAVPANTFLRGNAIRDSNFHAITIHGTQGVVVDSNVAYNITGHAVMLEDGAESNNIITNNLIVLVKEKVVPAMLGSDSFTALSAFYITNTDNTISNNVVAGVEGTGFWIDTRIGVKGFSYATGKYNDIHPYRLPVREMRGNTIHSAHFGLKVESPNLDAQDSPQQTLYSPPYTYSPDEMPVFKDFVVHHVRQGGWFRMYRMVVDGWSVADATEGVQVLTQGNTATSPTETYVINSLFVGGSANRGNLVESDWQFINYLEQRSDSALDRSNDARVGIKLYDGPLYVQNCVFRNWYAQPCLNYINTAIGTRLFNTFAMSAATSVANLTFEDTPFKVLVSDQLGDGGKTTLFRDLDGAIAGNAGATILPDWDFYYTQQCKRSLHWGLSCPHSYANFDIISVDDNVDPDKFGPLAIYRSNVEDAASTVPSLQFDGQYIPASNGWLYHPVLSAGASYAMQFPKHTPSHLTIVLSAANVGDQFELAVCYPLGTAIKTVTDLKGHALPPMKAWNDHSCANCFFYDQTRYVLIIRMMQTQARPALANACPSVGCLTVDVVVTLPTADDPSAGVTDVLTQAYPLLVVNDTGAGSWLGQSFHHESLMVDSPMNMDWCQVEDPCLDSVDEGNRRMGILAYYDKNCNGIGCFTDTCRYCKLSISGAVVPFLPCPFDPNGASGTSSGGTPPSSGNSNSNCSKFSSPGDRAVGVFVVDDASCLSGGLGCVNNAACRMCKSFDSIQSAAFLNCSTITGSGTSTATGGASSGTTATSPNDRCSQQVSSGDNNVGVSAFEDATCVHGGLGCFADTCRFCKTRETPQASQFDWCSRQDPCVAQVSTGDQNVGISAFSDDVCSSAGGLGCFGSCRFCKVRETPQSSQFTNCSNAPTTHTTSASSPSSSPSTSSDLTKFQADPCWSYSSPGDVAVGVVPISDTTCQAGGLGCLTPSCRFCGISNTPQASPYLPCDQVLGVASPQSPSSAPTNAQTPPAAVPTSPQDPCVEFVSSGDMRVGVSSMTDTSCAHGGLGCFSDRCRYCKKWPTLASENFVDCEKATTAGEFEDFGVFTTADACASTISTADAVTGLHAFADSTCADFGPGCVSTTCRHCKTAETAPGADKLETCPQSVAAPSQFESEPVAINTVSSSSTVLSDDDCAAAVKVWMVRDGISAFMDASCVETDYSSTDENDGTSAATSTGCFAMAACRYCKFLETTRSHSFTSCPFPNHPVVAKPESCSDVAARQGIDGISASYDPRCVNSVVSLLPGCVQYPPCRLCWVTLNSDNRHLPSCRDQPPADKAFNTFIAPVLMDEGIDGDMFVPQAKPGQQASLVNSLAIMGGLVCFLALVLVFQSRPKRAAPHWYDALGAVDALDSDGDGLEPTPSEATTSSL
ncbi:TPA: hypothetical protein N0F65_010747 [Lagenidium giganteum]|uniref:G8 domain-containing protein n=1 Tax=Lagenidium giganteum TaxID=4803 RepID=A0AAV2YN28_9STRA|nr:TPA: hypothetical protein N0F65_010747 [Lagenidium giganteum]